MKKGTEISNMAHYTPSHVANFILDNAEKEDVPLTPLKLLKLVYLCYGWVRAITDIRLFEEHFEAWDYGPVIPSLYGEFKRYGGTAIPSFEKSYVYDFEREPYIARIADHQRITSIMQKCWDAFKIYKASALVNETHEADGPWIKVFEKGKNNLLQDVDIKAFFQRKIRAYIDASK
jgi:uncharacterized phage-associated protein